MKKLLVSLILISTQFVKSDNGYNGYCSRGENHCYDGYVCPPTAISGRCFIATSYGVQPPACNYDEQCQRNSGNSLDFCSKGCVPGPELATKLGKDLITKLETEKKSVEQQAQKGGQDLKAALAKGKAAQGK